jgi:BirA family transcriptional regulator, biotin operon repressor / biotin---[acetyl-CoA-carboxylase] ligase
MVKQIGWKMIHYERVTSTNDVLKSMTGHWECEGVVIAADEQTHGRGQHDRSWISAPGLGLYCSVLIKPHLHPQFCGLLSIYSAVAVRRALCAVAEVKPQLKWPNDILIEDKKMCGILIETSLIGHKFKYVIIGIGINLNHSLSDFTPELQSQASSLFLCTGKKYDRQQVLTSVVSALQELSPLLEQTHKSKSKLIQEWLDHCSHLHRPVVVTTNGSSLTGTFEGLDECGQALIHTNNKIVTVQNYDLFSVRSLCC